MVLRDTGKARGHCECQKPPGPHMCPSSFTSRPFIFKLCHDVDLGTQLEWVCWVKQSPQPTKSCLKRPYKTWVMWSNPAATHLFRALHISIVTSTDRAIVVGYRDSKISQSTPSNTGLSSVHRMKFLCQHRNPPVNMSFPSGTCDHHNHKQKGGGEDLNSPTDGRRPAVPQCHTRTTRLLRPPWPAPRTL